jgi:hypothetical protein
MVEKSFVIKAAAYDKRKAPAQRARERFRRYVFLQGKRTATDRKRAGFDKQANGVKSGLAAARARGKKFGRQPGQRPKSDRVAPKVLEALESEKIYR